MQQLAAAWFGALGIVFSTPLLLGLVVLVQTFYLQDVLWEPVAVLGEHEDDGKE